MEKEYFEMNKKERIEYLEVRIKMDREQVATLKRQMKVAK